MAESYRGLTIRIGGDTTKLSKALKTANQAASQTTAELRKIGQALKLDPNSIQAYNAQLDYMSDHATNTAMKLAQLRDAVAAAGSERIVLSDGTEGTIEELSKAMGGYGSEIENVSGKLAVAKDRLDSLTSTLATMHTEVSELTSKAAKLERVKLGAAFDLATGRKTVEEITKKFENLNDGVERTPEMIEAIVASTREMGDALKESIHIDEGVFDVSGLRDKLQKIFSMSGFKLDFGNEHLQARLDEIERLGNEYVDAYQKALQKQGELTAAQKSGREAAAKGIAEEAESRLAEIQGQMDALRSERATRIEDDRTRLEEMKANAVDLTNKHYDEQISKLKAAGDAEARLTEEMSETKEEAERLSSELDSVLSNIARSWDQLSDSERATWSEAAPGLGQGETRSQWWDTYRETLLEDYATGLGRQLELEQKLLDIERQRAEAGASVSDDQAAASLALEDALRRQIDHIERIRESDGEIAVSQEQHALLIERLVSLSGRLKSISEENKDVESQVEQEIRKQSAAVAELQEKVSQNRRDRKSEADEYKAIIASLEKAKTILSDGGDASDALASIPDEFSKSVKSASDAETAIAEVRKRDAESRKQHAAVTRQLNIDIKKQVAEEVEARKKAAVETADVDDRIVEAERRKADALRNLTDGSGNVTMAGMALAGGEVEKAYSEFTKRRADATKSETERMKGLEEDYKNTAVGAYEEIGEAMEGATDDGEALAAVEAQLDKLTNDMLGRLAKFGKNMPGLVGEVFKSDNGNTDPDYMNAVLDRISANLGLSASETIKFKESMSRLSGEFRNADSDFKDLKKIMKFDDLLVEVTKTEAGIKSLARAMSEMHAPSELMRGMYVLNANADELEKAFKTLSSTGGTLSVIYQADPSNMEAARQAANAFAAAEMVASENAQVMKKRVDAFDSDEIDAVTDSTKSATQQLFDASQAAERAQESYNALSGELQYLYAMRARLRGQQTETLDPSITGDAEAMEEFEARVREAAEDQAAFAQRISVTEAKVSELNLANKEAQEALEGARMRKEYDEAAAGATEWAATAKRAAEQARQAFVQQSLAEAFGDTSSISRLSAQISSLTSSAGAFSKAMELDPQNVDLAEARFRKLSEAESLATQRVADLESNISKVDTSSVDRLREKYGSVTEAVTKLRDVAGVAADNMTKAINERLSQIDNGGEASYLNAIRDKLLNPDATFGKYELDFLPEGIREARREVEDFGVASERSMNELVEAEKAVKFEEWTEDLAAARAELEKISRQKTESIVDSATNAQFGELNRQLKQYDDAIKVATYNARKYNDALKADPGSGDYKEKRMLAVAEATRLADEKAKLLNQTLSRFNADKLSKLRDEYGSLSLASDKTKEKLTRTQTAMSLLRAEVERFASENKKGDDWVRQFENAEAEIGDIPPELQVVRAKLLELKSVRFDQEIDAQVAAICAQLEKMGVDAETAGEILRRSLKFDGDAGSTKTDQAAITQVMTQISQYAERAGRAVVESANTIDSAYRDMRKTVDGTEKQFEALHKSAVEFSQTNAVSADQILEMESLGGQLGVAIEKLQSFGEVASHLDIATNIGAEDIALQMGQLSNIMSDFSHDNFENFADSLVRLGNNMPTTEAAIMEVAQRMAAVANVTSMTTPELLSWSAAIASTGQRSESAATAINNTITGIGAAVAEGGKTLEGFASIANMTSDEFRQAWEESSTDALKAFVIGLQGLTDDSTDAIAALDSVGISGVRQRTALLALSQTIQNLDKSLTMSTDAWNGIGDQWGAAGDAAREADEKSKGFSGALQILKNNAADLAASLGDSLVGPMNAISAVLKTLTDFLNSLPGPIKTAVVAVGGFTIAIGPLINAVNQLRAAWTAMQGQMAADALTGGMANGIKAAASSLKNLITLFTQSIASGLTFKQAMGNVAAQMNGLSGLFAQSMASGLTFGQSMGNVAAQLTGATGAASGLTAALGSGALLGVIGIVIAVVGALVAEIAGAIDRTNRLNEANDRLAESSSRLAKAGNEAAESQKKVATSFKGIKEGAEETIAYIEKLAEKEEQLASRIEQNQVDFDSQATLVNEAREAIDKYANTSNLSRDAQADLVFAVQTLNDALGSNYEVVDAANGVIRKQGSDVNETTAAIDAFIEKQLEMAEAEAVYESIKEANKELLEAENELAEKRAENAKLLEKSNDTAGNTIDMYNGVSSATVAASASLSQSNQQLEAAQTHYDSVKGKLNELKGEYRELAKSSLDASVQEADAIAAAASKMDVLVDAFSRTGSSSDRFASQLQSLGGTAESFGSLTEAQIVAIAQAYDGSVASIQSALQRLGISFKTAMGEAGAAAATKPDDSAVRAFKNEQEAAYTAAKREVDDYYNSEKAAKDKAYNDEKRRLDNEYDSLKKSLDKAYDARKSELDREYSAAKSASDKYLKNFKESQDEAVKAFKAATESRLADLKREYEYKKKLIEDEEAADTADVDGRIAAQKAETQAEKDAEGQRSRQKKVGELVSFDEVIVGNCLSYDLPFDMFWFEMGRCAEIETVYGLKTVMAGAPQWMMLFLEWMMRR